MFIVTINGIDASKHTQEQDAIAQKARFEALSMGTTEIVEKETFEPAE